jgi:hypothetical protein
MASDHRYSIDAEAGYYFIAGSDAALPVTQYHEILLNISKNLFKQGQYSFAIVICHTACEILVERIITKAFDDKKAMNLRKFIVSNSTSYNLGAKTIKSLYTALTGDNEIQKQSFWKEFKSSVDRRNDIVHRGKMFQQGDAEKSLKAASDLITYLDRKF